jgi:hypothetical protein
VGGASVAHSESPVSERPRARTPFGLAQTGDLVLVTGGSVAKVLDRLEKPARLRVELMHGAHTRLKVRPDEVLARPWRQLR